MRNPRGGRGDRHPRRDDSRRRRQPRAEAESSTPVRLQVFLARAGIASRRASEEIILEGRVTVNGSTVTELGTKVDASRDEVAVDGQTVSTAAPVWVALHKPRGYVTTRSDPSGRRTVYDLLPDELHVLFHVGRLDRQSEGLLLLTNEGAVANRLLHPRYGLDKEYIATVDGEMTYEALDQIVEGIHIGDEALRAETAEVLPGGDPGQTRLRLILREGRYREVRRMLEAVGYPVSKLTRRRFGPIRLARLARGKWRFLTREEIESLRRRDASEPA